MFLVHGYVQVSARGEELNTLTQVRHATRKIQEFAKQTREDNAEQERAEGKSSNSPRKGRPQTRSQAPDVEEVLSDESGGSESEEPTKKRRRRKQTKGTKKKKRKKVPEDFQAKANFFFQ